MSLYNTNSQLNNFYNDDVNLPTKERDKMRGRRDTNRKRLKKGLKRNENPDLKKHLIQGSYAMRTMIQRLDNDYDIDDGAIFHRDELKGPKGADKKPHDARQMVCDALQDDKFNTPPEVRDKCVRILYNEGYHIDVPVYRQWTDDENETHLELSASSAWRESDPRDITSWFKNTVRDKSPETKPPYQLNKIVCLLKKWASSRPSWNMPSGLIFSVLADEEYQRKEDRDDEAFIDVLKKIKQRLNAGNKEVFNPTDASEDLAAARSAQMDSLQECLTAWLPKLDILTDDNCDNNDAMDAWNSFFNTGYFDKHKKTENEEREAAALGFLKTDGKPSSPVKKGGQDSFG